MAEPAGGVVQVEVYGVSDQEAFPEPILALRRSKEQASTQRMLKSKAHGGPLGLRSLHDAQRWLFRDHKAYAASIVTRGQELAKMTPEDRELLKTY